MNAKHRALLWEELRVGGPIAAVCLATGLLMLGSLILQFGEWHRVDALVMNVTVGVPVLLALLLILNTANTGHLTGGFSRRILNLPVETASTVAIVLLTRLILVITVSAVMLAACHAIFGHGPTPAMILACAALYLLVQIIDWSRAVTFIFIPLAASVGVIAYEAARVGVITRHELPYLIFWGSILAVPVAYGLSYYFVQSARHGQRLGQRTVAVPSVSLSRPLFRLRERRPFSSPLTALTWWELKRAGLFFPAMVLVGWALAALVVWLGSPRNEGMFLGEPIGHMNWIFLEILPYIALLLASLSWGLRSFYLRKRRNQSFLLRQPVYKQQMAQAHLLAGGINLGLSLAVVSIISTLTFLYTDQGLIARILSESLSRGETNWREIFSIIVGPPLVVGLISWCIMGNLSLFLPRKKLTLKTLAIVTACISVLVGLSVIGYYLNWDGGILVGGGGLLLMSWFIYLVARRLTLTWQNGLMNARSLVASVGAFCLLTLFLFPFESLGKLQSHTIILDEIQIGNDYAVHLMLICLALAALAVLPFPSTILLLKRTSHDGGIGQERTDGTSDSLSVGMMATALIVVCFIGWLRWPVEPAWKDAWRANGLPTSLEEMGSWYPPVAEEENLAILYRHAAQKASVAEWTWGYMNGYKQLLVQGEARVERTEQIPENVWATSRQYADTVNKDVAQDLHHAAASGLTQSRYNVDLREGCAVALPQLAALRTLARVLSLESYVNTLEGRSHEAARDIADIIPMANSLEKEPILISQLVRMAILGIALGALQDPVMNRGELSDEDLAHLQEALARALPPVEQERIIERALIFETLVAATFSVDALFIQAERARQLHSLFAPFSSVLLDAVGASEFNDILTVYSTRRILSFGQEPTANKALKRTRYDRQFRRNGDDDFWTSHLMFRAPLTGILFPALSHSHVSERRLRTNLDLAITAIAVERFRLAQGCLPQTLDELVPAYLEKIPADYWHEGKPLSYLIRDNGEFVVYSYSDNFRDDLGDEGGEVDGEFRRALDLTFTVPPPETRAWLRQLGPPRADEEETP